MIAYSIQSMGPRTQGEQQTSGAEAGPPAAISGGSLPLILGMEEKIATSQWQEMVASNVALDMNNVDAWTYKTYKAGEGTLAHEKNSTWSGLIWTHTETGLQMRKQRPKDLGRLGNNFHWVYREKGWSAEGGWRDWTPKRAEEALRDAALLAIDEDDRPKRDTVFDIEAE